MLQLIIDNQIVDLDSALNLTFRNPIFDKNGLAKGYSYPFSFSWTDTNIKIFNNSHRLDAKIVNKKYTAELRLFSETSVNGYFYITNRDKEGGKGYFLNESRNIAKRLEDVTAKDLLNETNLVPNSNPANFKYKLFNTTYTTGQLIRIRINNYNFDFIVGSPAESAITIMTNLKNQIEDEATHNAFDTSLLILNLQNDTDGASIELIVSIYAGRFYVQPNFYDGGLSPHNLTIINQRFQSTAIAEAIAAFQLSLLTDGSHLFPKYINKLAYDNQKATFFGSVNRKTVVGYVSNLGTANSGEWQHTATPMCKIRHVLDKLAILLDIEWDGNFTLSDIEDILIFNPKTIDLEIQDKDDLYYNVFNPAYNLKNHVPDINILDVFELIKNSFFVFFEFKNGVLKIKDINEKLSLDAFNISNYINKDLSYETPEFNSFAVIMEKDSTDDFINATLENYTVGEAVETHQIADTTYNEVLQKQDADFNFRLVKYDGIDINGAANITAYDTPTDSYNNNRLFFKYLFNSKTIKVQAILPPHILLKLITFENPILRLETDNGNVQGVLESINFKMTINKMSKVNLEIRVI